MVSVPNNPVKPARDVCPVTDGRGAFGALPDTMEVAQWYDEEAIDGRAERGGKVLFTTPQAGWESDGSHALRFLIPGRIYEVCAIEVGRSSTKVYLKDWPNTPFNSVHFIDWPPRIETPEPPTP